MKFFFALLACAFGFNAAGAQPADSIDIKIGQMVLLGVGDATRFDANSELADALQRGYLGGIVLFEKNLNKWNAPDSLRRFTSDMQQAASIPLFISIDEEGGKVHRLKEKYGFPAMPSASYLGYIDKADSTLFYNRRLAETLADAGINLNYAPDVDLAVNPMNTVIYKAERSFGFETERVVKHAKLCIRAHHENGVKTVLKHFPGHGSSMSDSHFGVADVTKTWKLQELLPYESLLTTTDAVMVGHMVNARWDTSLLPATLSASTVSLLRNLIGFKGVIISDDMQMQAVRDRYGLETTIRLSINAGIDVLVFANTLTSKDKFVSAQQVHGIIKKLLREKKIPMQRINESYARIMKMKADLPAVKTN